MVGQITESHSKIFRSYRTLGLVSDGIPLITRYIHRRKENLIVTSSGRVFQTWGASKLGLLNVSKVHPENITAMTGDTYMVFVAAGNLIYAWRRGSELKHLYRGHTKSVHSMITFGPHLISVDAESSLKIWEIKTEKLIIEFEFSNSVFEIKSILHPSTYINKILLGSKQGSLQLWNIKSGKKIYRFCGWNSAVLCIEQAPAVDVVAIGLQSGFIFIHNILVDETIVSFNQEWSAVRCMTFRSDGEPILISTSECGKIAVWDLEERKLSSEMREAHSSAISGARFLPNEPILVTSSSDNTLKQWIFDLPDGGGRLLRIRKGHSEPPNRIRFYGALGENILSAGKDSSLQCYSTVADILNKSFGIASYNRKAAKRHKMAQEGLKMEPIIDFTTETTREKEWDNIACVHSNTTIVSTWSYDKHRMGELKLRHSRFKKNPELRSVRATCVCLSVCGNFVLIGYASGHVDKFNIQSGLHRGELLSPGATSAHPEREIRGICSDALNEIVVTGDNHGSLRFWRFKNLQRLGQRTLSASIVKMELHRENSLMSVALVDFTVAVVDIICRKVVRTFEGHDNHITDMVFSPNCRWILTSSLDSTVKVWDVPSGKLVDHFAFKQAVTSLTFSPRSDFLATSHVNDLGIYLWSNITILSHITLRPLPDDFKPPIMQLETVDITDINETYNTVMVDDDDVIDDDDETYVSPSQISHQLVTMSNLAKSRWQNLLSLDVIRARNKPMESLFGRPKTPAPFFLPTISGLETRFDISVAVDDEASSLKTKPIAGLPIVTLTPFGHVLMNSKSKEDFLSILARLKELGPSAIDSEIASLAPEAGGSVEVMEKFLNMIEFSLEGRMDFEVTQAYLGLFLKKHSEAFLAHDCLLKSLERLQAVQAASWTDLSSVLASSATLVGFYRNALIC